MFLMINVRQQSLCRTIPYNSQISNGTKTWKVYYSLLLGKSNL